MSIKPKSIDCQFVGCNEQSVPGERFCRSCKKATIKSARESGVAYSESAPKTFSDMRGRKALRSTQAIGGMADTRESDDTYL